MPHETVLEPLSAVAAIAVSDPRPEVVGTTAILLCVTTPGGTFAVWENAVASN